MINDAQFTNYDNIDVDIYLKHIERPNSWNNLYERPAFIERLPPLKGKQVLDIGCASGTMTEYALKAGASVTAVDISRQMIDRLNARIESDKLKTYRTDISQPMPFLKNNFYDCVTCSLVLHYIKDWPPVLSELYRVLKKGGRMIISTHHPFAIYLYFKPESYFDFKLVEDVWGKRETNPFKVHYYIRPLNEVLRPFIQSKFKIISIDEPLPNEACKNIDPKEYEKLTTQPGFLFIVLEK